MVLYQKFNSDVLINKPNVGDQDQPSIAALSDGGYVVLWEGPTVHWQRFSASGAKTGPEVTLKKAPAPGTPSSADITALAGGGFVVSWSQGTKSFVQVFSSTGAPAKPPVEIADNPFSGAPPLIASLIGGAFVATYNDGLNDYGQVFNSSGVRIGSEFMFPHQYITDIASLNNGGFVVVGAASISDGSGSAVSAQIYNANGTPIAPEFIVNEDTFYDQVYPNVAALGNGNFVVTWLNQNVLGFDGNIKARVFNSSGSAVVSEFLVNAAGGFGQLDPTVTALPGGGFAIAWTEQVGTGGDTSGSAIRLKVFTSSGVAVTAEILVNSTTLGDQIEPSVTALANGDILVTWTDQSGAGADGNGIRAQVIRPFADQTGDGSANLIDGTGTHDLLIGLAGNDTLNGSTGDDILNGGDDADLLNGGAGIDTAVYTSSPLALTVDLLNPLANTNQAAGDTFISIENIRGTNLADILRGDNAANYINGDNNNDTLVGRGGADTLDGGAGDDTADYSSALKGVVADLEKPSANKGDAAGDIYMSVERLLGSAFADTLLGDSGDNTLTGGDGNDILEGRYGADSLAGGIGSDTASYASVVAGPIGVIADLATPANNLFGAEGDSYSSIENLMGSNFADILAGDGGVNVLSGLAGNDLLDGLGGADKLDGGAGSDTASYLSAVAGIAADLMTPLTNTGDAAGDTYISIESLEGSVHGDILKGNSGANGLFGDFGNDTLDGRGGNDTLHGGDGADMLTGGTGKDSFRYDLASEGGDSIIGFSLKDDRFQISASGFGGNLLPTQGLLNGVTFIANAAPAATTGAGTFLYETDTFQLRWDADGNGGGAAVLIATFTTATTLTAANFDIIA